jgi:hypothetical protein
MNIKKYSNDSVIQRYCKETNLESKTAEEHFIALKHFLLLCSKSEEPCFPSKQLDEIWHTFLLYTKDYYSFCKEGLGKFVHHIPFNNETDKVQHFKPGYFCYIQGNKMKKKYVSNLKQLEKVFKADCGSGGDCSSCSSCRD